jgi:hypothetical protein
MAVLSMFNRAKRSGVLCNVTDHVMQLARLTRVDERPVIIDSLSEVPIADDGAVTQWLDRAFNEPRGQGYLPGYCGFHPPERTLLRENINTRRMAEPDYLEKLVMEHAKLTALRDWQVTALHPIDGEPLAATMPSRPGLLVGWPIAAAREAQNRARKFGIRARRLEVGSVPLLGALGRHLRERAYPHAVVACEIGRTETRIYFLAKDGVHTPSTLPHGLLSIEEAAMKELAVPDIGAARLQLASPTEELRTHSRRLVRMLTRHLKPAVDYFEMQTGQPIGALFCSHLPEELSWLEQALSAAIDLEFLAPDMAAWLPQIGVELAPGTAMPSRSWFQALSLIGQLAPPVVHEAKS